MSYKRRLELTIYVPDGKYCNVGPKETCRFCVKHCNGHTCAISQDLLQYDGKMIIKTQDCVRLSPKPQSYTDADIKVSPKTLINATVDHFVKAYKVLRKTGITEEMCLDIVQKDLKEGK